MISPDGIEILNTARRILARADRDAMREAWEVDGNANLGRTAEAACVAADAIFNFLNVAHNYGGVIMTEEELHGKKLLEEVEA
jgi:hypothetical protein